MKGRAVTVTPFTARAEVIRDPGYVGIDGRHWLTVRMPGVGGPGGEPWTFDAPCYAVIPLGTGGTGSDPSEG